MKKEKTPQQLWTYARMAGFLFIMFGGFNASVIHVSAPEVQVIIAIHAIVKILLGILLLKTKSNKVVIAMALYSAVTMDIILLLVSVNTFFLIKKMNKLESNPVEE